MSVVSLPIAFLCVEVGITNVISTFLDHMLAHLGFHQHTIGMIGAGFQVAIMAGSLVVGSYVDRTKKYVGATVFCFIFTFLFVSGASEKELHGSGLVVCILCIGFFAGPIQPITAELAVEVRTSASVFGPSMSPSSVATPRRNRLTVALVVGQVTFPADENSIVAVQQILGNAFSALLVPLSHRVKHLHMAAFDIRSDYFLLLTVCGAGAIYFCTFNAPLLRLKAEAYAAPPIQRGPSFKESLEALRLSANSTSARSDGVGGNVNGQVNDEQLGSHKDSQGP